jgi:DMSO/TMAO reductase YedYZ heme-binding membrane subunit
MIVNSLLNLVYLILVILVHEYLVDARIKGELFTYIFLQALLNLLFLLVHLGCHQSPKRGRLKVHLGLMTYFGD